MCDDDNVVHGLMLAKDGSQGVEDTGDKVELVPSGFVFVVESAGQHALVQSMALFDKVAYELSHATFASDHVQGVTKGCTLAYEGQGILHVFIELIKGLISAPSITQGLICLINAEKIKNANQLVSAASGMGSTRHDVRH